MPQVDFVYDVGCPNVATARASLLQAFSQAGLPPSWSEYRSDDAHLPQPLRGYGSPTILVDGRDVAGEAAQGGSSCRLYPGGTGAPSADLIAQALARAKKPSAQAPRSTWSGALTVLPGVAMALLPKVACPACWPAYAGALTSLGLGFLMDTAWLLPLTAVFLAFAVGALAWRAKQRRGYAPFLVGLVAATVVLVGKFAFDSDPAMWAGLALLVGASLWNSWPKRAIAACPSCQTA